MVFLYSNCGFLTFMSVREGLVSGIGDRKREEEIGLTAKSSNPIKEKKQTKTEFLFIKSMWMFLFFILLCCKCTSFHQISCAHGLQCSVN